MFIDSFNYEPKESKKKMLEGKKLTPCVICKKKPSWGKRCWNCYKKGRNNSPTRRYNRREKLKQKTILN